MSNLLDKASILLTPTAYDNGSMLSIKPENGDGDFQFSRNSAATRVNAQGLVENVQILSPELVSNGNFSEIGTEEVLNGNFSQEGIELITNGDFATDSNWNKGAGWTISGGSANSDGTNNYDQLTQNNVLTIGKSYKLTFDLTYISGALRTHPSIDVEYNSSGNYTLYFVASATNLIFTTWGAFTGSIDNVSVKEVGQNWDLGSGWSIGDGEAVTDGTINKGISQEGILTSGKFYKISLDINVSSGSLSSRLRFFDSNSSGTTISGITSSGTYTFYASANKTGFQLISLSDNTAEYTVTNISVKEVGQDWTFNTGWSIDQANSKVIGDGTMSGSNVVRQIIYFTQGAKYRFSFEVKDYVSGSLFIREPFNGYSDAVSANGSYSFDYVAGINDYIDFRGNSFVGSFTNISVKEITDDTNIPRINYEEFSYQDTLGSEEIVNGDFSNGSANWTLGTGWTISGGSANYDGLQAYQLLRQGTANGVVGKTYLVKYDVINNSGSGGIYAKFGGVNLSSYNSDNGSFEFYVVAVSTDYIRFLPQLNFTGSIDNVSVKEVTGQEVVPDSGCGSWLLEPQSTNLITYSEDFSQWGIGGDTTIESGYSAPDGTNNAYKVSGTNNFIYLNASLLTTTTRSIYARTVSGTGQAHLCSFNGNSNNLFTITEQWQRFDVNSAISTGVTNFYGVDFRGSTTLSEIIIWGANATNDQDYVTSYIPTNGAASTRLQDIAKNSGNSSLINSTEGVLYAEIAALADDLTNRMIALSDSNSSDHVRIYYTNSTNKISVAIKSNGSNQYIFLNYNVTDITSYIKIAVKYKANDFATFINGVKVNSQTTTSSAPIGLDRLNFDSGVGGSPFYGKAKALAVYKEALTDAELQSLTTI